MRNWEHALARTLERRWRSYRKALKRCQRNFSEVSIHASRIEARRMAAQFELFRVFTPRRAFEMAQAALKHHLDTFDPLRDAQVQLIMLNKEYRGMPGAKPIEKLTAKRERRCQRKAGRQIREVRTRRIKDVVELLTERLQEASRNPERMRLDHRNIVRSVDSAFNHVVECHRHMDPAHAATIHRMRIAFKKFRYMMESIQLLFPEITAPRLAAMQAFQGVMGDLQDTDVFLMRLDKLIRKKRVGAEEIAPLRRSLLRRHTRQTNLCLYRANVVFKFWPLKSAGKNKGVAHGNLSASSWHSRRT